jgi:cobalamin biosynthesis protein CobW
MTLPTKIPATVVTGFLGAGKTTLIRHLIQNAAGRRFAFIINEFGDLGVDRELIRGCGFEDCKDEDIVELANGCICCTVADDFIPAMEALIDRDDPPDHIIIETSGLALPKPLIKAFNWPEVRSRVTVDGVIAVVDAPAVADGRFADEPDLVQEQRETDDALDHDNPLEEVFSDQILSSDIILINKTDLLGADGMGAVEAEVARWARTGSKIIATSHGAVDARVLLGIGAEAESDIDARPSCHDGLEEHDHDDFDSFHLDLGAITDVDALEARLKQAVQNFDVFRIKGFLDVAGKDMRQVIQGVGARFERYFDRPWDAGESRFSRIVVIGRSGMDKAAIAKAITG